VRSLDREIGAICRKVAKVRAETGDDPGWVTAKGVERYLGKARYKRHEVDHDPEVGVVTGLAWTEVGGEILEIEATALPGAGKLMLTGNLKDVMKESGETALSYARSRCPDRASWYKEQQFHIHVPEGAVPKDGPSAGVAMATALVSLFSGRKVRRDVAMTGELTLRGKVLAIGGLPEKAVAAVRSGAKHLIIPRDNEKDYQELSPVVRKELTVHLVETMDEVLGLALLNED